MRLNTDGMVIREQNIGEADRRVILLTRDYGIVHAFARGARRIKSNALTATQLLSYSRFSIFQGRDSYIIDEAEPIEVFFCSAWKHGGALPRPLFCPAYGGAGPGAGRRGALSAADSKHAAPALFRQTPAIAAEGNL